MRKIAFFTSTILVRVKINNYPDFIFSWWFFRKYFAHFPHTYFFFRFLIIIPQIQGFAPDFASRCLPLCEPFNDAIDFSNLLMENFKNGWILLIWNWTLRKTSHRNEFGKSLGPISKKISHSPQNTSLKSSKRYFTHTYYRCFTNTWHTRTRR